MGMFSGVLSNSFKSSQLPKVITALTTLSFGSLSISADDTVVKSKSTPQGSPNASSQVWDGVEFLASHTLWHVDSPLGKLAGGFGVTSDSQYVLCWGESSSEPFGLIEKKSGKTKWLVQDPFKGLEKIETCSLTKEGMIVIASRGSEQSKEYLRVSFWDPKQGRMTSHEKLELNLNSNSESKAITPVVSIDGRSSSETKSKFIESDGNLKLLTSKHVIDIDPKTSRSSVISLFKPGVSTSVSRWCFIEGRVFCDIEAGSQNHLGYLEQDNKLRAVPGMSGFSVLAIDKLAQKKLLVYAKSHEKNANTQLMCLDPKSLKVDWVTQTGKLKAVSIDTSDSAAYLVGHVEPKNGDKPQLEIFVFDSQSGKFQIKKPLADYKGDHRYVVACLDNSTNIAVESRLEAERTLLSLRRISSISGMGNDPYLDIMPIKGKIFSVEDLGDGMIIHFSENPSRPANMIVGIFNKS